MSRGIALPVTTTALEVGEGSDLRPGRSLPPGKTQYPLYTRLAGPLGRSGQVWKISPPRGSDPRAVQLVAIRSTDATWPTDNHIGHFNTFGISGAAFLVVEAGGI